MVQKKYPTLGCCGLDCGLCPRYYTAGSSRCPGCSGPNFFNKHPSCSYITCCVKKRNLEVCAQCDEFPCSKFKSRLEDDEKYDSFLTYKKVSSNLGFIKKHGLVKFIRQQKKRIRVLKIMLKDFDDGRSKSFYCLAATLLPIIDLETSLSKTKKKIRTDKIIPGDIKTRSKILKKYFSNATSRKRIELRLRKKGK